MGDPKRSHDFFVQRPVVDKGYAALCRYCGDPMDFKKELIGQPRELEFSECEWCAPKKGWVRERDRLTPRFY